MTMKNKIKTRKSKNGRLFADNGGKQRTGNPKDYTGAKVEELQPGILLYKPGHRAGVVAAMVGYMADKRKKGMQAALFIERSWHFEYFFAF